VSPDPGIELNPAQAATEIEPLIELPGEKPLGDSLPEAEIMEPVEPPPAKESKPVSTANISSTTPTASSTTHDNESFPL